jgi:hypothetical protein
LSSEEKPDGWVAWHPKHGFKSTTSYGVEIHEDKGDAEYTFNLSKHEIADGWRIRPVKLVFLDEEKTT